MTTCRRELLDRCLESSIPLMRGRVLDIGGKKINKRGRFNPPLHQVENWEYLNTAPETQPDYCCDAAEIHLDDGTIDTVVMTEVLEYLKNPEVVLKEIYRILAAGGVCLLSTPLLNSIHGDWQFDRQRWTAIKLEEVCKAIGFNEIAVKPMGSVWSVIHDILHVSFGYAHPRPHQLYIKISRKLLRGTTPFLFWMDTKSKLLNKYINTGYFVVLRKH